MSIVRDLLDALEKIPLWKSLASAPERISALEREVAALKKQLEPAPGRRCDGCGYLGLRLASSRIVGSGAAKYVRQEWTCAHCRQSFVVQAPDPPSG